MKKRQFIHILQKYREGTATQEERAFIESYYALFETEPGMEAWLRKEKSEQLKAAILNDVWKKIQQQPACRSFGAGREEVGSKPARIKNFHIHPVRVAAAVAVLLATSFMIYFFSNRPTRKSEPVVKSASGLHYKNDIKPGGNKAVLTLANGQRVTLDSASQGTLLKHGPLSIRKQNKGELVYQSDKDSKGGTRYNTITIPRGGQYKVVLSDGTKVWLNAGSSLHYPVSFNKEYRKVTLSGEGYFEVAKRIKQPFIVKAGGTEIQVLGTHFNVSAYKDENTIQTTLTEGAVKVIAGSASKVLKPGEQAGVNNQTGNIHLKSVDIDRVLAWKDGLFNFQNTNITAIMLEVARWYDVKVIYHTKDLKNKNYSGVVSRYSNVDALLKRMELTGTVHFKVEGKTIVVED